MPSYSQAALRLWNAGAEESAFIAAGLQQEYSDLEKRYGCASIPAGDLYRSRWGRTQEEIDKENAGYVGGMTYGDWKGETGPGKMLRDIVARERAKQGV